LITAAALILVFLKFSELKLVGRIFLTANLFWLGGIIITQILSYYSLALNYRDVLMIKDLKIKAISLFPVTFIVQFLNQAIPSATISGQIFFIQYLKKYGLSVIEGIGRAILEILTLIIAFGVLFFMATILLAFDGQLASNWVVAYIMYIFLFISVALILAFFAFQKTKQGRISKWLINLFHRFFDKYDIKNRTDYVSLILDQMRQNLNLKELTKKKGLLFKAAFWQGLILILNILTLFFISYAIGSKISFLVAFIVFTLIKFISLIAFVPGALGIFEGGMTLLLISFGVGAGPALTMTLLFRAFTFWIPMPIGWLLYRYFLHRQELESPEP
jgi:uncharacterized protein (TIRG00374 family)